MLPQYDKANFLLLTAIFKWDIRKNRGQTAQKDRRYLIPRRFLRHSNGFRDSKHQRHSHGQSIRHLRPWTIMSRKRYRFQSSQRPANPWIYRYLGRHQKRSSNRYFKLQHRSRRWTHIPGNLNKLGERFLGQYETLAGS
jgi:hypothetical protein